MASVENVLRLVKMLKVRESLTLTAASRELGVAPSTVHRLLAMLRYYDFASQDPLTKAYVPGPTLLAIVPSLTGGVDVRAVVRPELKRLVGSVAETAHLVVLERSDARFLDSVECDRVLRVTSRVGTRLPAILTAGGKALLARLGDDELGARLGAVPEPLRRQLAQIRRMGYATNFGESEEGLAAVAVALPDVPAELPSLSVSVSAPQSRMTSRHAADLVEQAVVAARRAAQRLGSPEA